MIRQTIIRHFDNPSIQLVLDGSFVPHGYPCFTLSATYCYLVLIKIQNTTNYLSNMALVISYLIIVNVYLRA